MNIKVRFALAVSAVLAGICVAVWILILAWSWVLTWVGPLNPNVAAALITGGVGLIGLWYVQWRTQAREIAESHRSEKIAVYKIFFDIVDEFKKRQRDGTPLSTDDMPEPLQANFEKLHRELIVWASPQVLRAWLRFKTVPENSGNQMLLAVDNLYREIRRDLGNSNRGLSKGDLVRATVRDPENLVK